MAFVPCLAEEDYGRSSKSNKGQVALVAYIVELLRTLQLPENRRAPGGAAIADNCSTAAAQLASVSVAVLTPYSAQARLLKQTLPGEANATVSTVDGFQGRESDIVVLSTVRSTLMEDIDLGFVADPRRLNVAWTRPRAGLIVVGDPRTLRRAGPLWERALSCCREVAIPPPEKPEVPSTSSRRR